MSLMSQPTSSFERSLTVGRKPRPCSVVVETRGLLVICSYDHPVPWRTAKCLYQRFRICVCFPIPGGSAEASLSSVFFGTISYTSFPSHDLRPASAVLLTREGTNMNSREASLQATRTRWLLEYYLAAGRCKSNSGHCTAASP